MTRLERAGLRALIAEEYHKAEKEVQHRKAELEKADGTEGWIETYRMAGAYANGQMNAYQTILTFLADE